MKWYLLIVIIIGAGSVGMAKQSEIFPLELIRMTSLGYKPFMANKTSSISVYRLPIAARYIIRSEPVYQDLDPIIPADFYKCVDQQVSEISAALSSKEMSIAPKQVVLIATESYAESSANVCIPMGEFLSEGKLVLQICLDNFLKYPSSCRAVSSANLINNYKQKDVSNLEKKNSHKKLVQNVENLLNLMSKE